MMYFSPDEIKYYSRQIILRDLGAEGQYRLKTSRVLVIGTGGLGSPCLYYLAGAGMGHIDVMDYDVVDVSNLHRQILFDTETVAQSKVEVAGNKLRALNPHIVIGLLNIEADEQILDFLLPDYDLVLDCTDMMETKLLVNDMCLKHSIPLCFSGVLGFECQLMTVIPHQTACLRCAFGNPQSGGNALPSCAEAGIIGAVAGIAGAMMATEAVKLLSQTGELMTNSLLLIDSHTNRFLTVECTKKNDCVCAV